MKQGKFSADISTPAEAHQARAKANELLEAGRITPEEHADIVARVRRVLGRSAAIDGTETRPRLDRKSRRFANGGGVIGPGPLQNPFPKVFPNVFPAADLVGRYGQEGATRHIQSQMKQGKFRF